jgi:hypothetical protein
MIRKTDANHKRIIDSCRKIPQLSVFSTHTIGKGFPDIVIGYKGINYLIEIKDGDKPKSQTKLTEDEITFHKKWNGQICIVYSFQDIINILQLDVRM